MFAGQSYFIRTNFQLAASRFLLSFKLFISGIIEYNIVKVPNRQTKILKIVLLLLSPSRYRWVYIYVYAFGKAVILTLQTQYISIIIICTYIFLLCYIPTIVNGATKFGFFVTQ